MIFFRVDDNGPIIERRGIFNQEGEDCVVRRQSIPRETRPVSDEIFSRVHQAACVLSVGAGCLLIGRLNGPPI